MGGLERFSKERTHFTNVLIRSRNPKSLMRSASACGK
jgi:hypothetical protein